MPFFTFRQNNSGGHFRGPQIVIIEAKDESHALQIAETSTEIYFDGCEKQLDCDCCGDRWSRYCDQSETPEVYGESILQTEKSGIVYYLDGTEKTF